MLLLSENLSGILFFCYCYFKVPANHFLISTFCTNFVFLHSKNVKLLHCLGLIDMLSANQKAEILVCILLICE